MNKLLLSSDNPVAAEPEDGLNFTRYLDPLGTLLSAPSTRTPLTIGVFGTWGSGKTSLLRLLDSRLETKYPDRFVRIWFNPWLYRSEPNLLVALLHTLHATLEAQTAQKFKTSATKIATVLANLGAGVFLKLVTAGTVSLENLNALEKDYLKAHYRVESEIRNLRANLQKEINDLTADGTRFVLFIDDLDRCDPAQIIDLLEAVKLFFDLENMIVILAVDKEVIDRGVQIKYKDFAFSQNRTSIVGEEYLEKMVQLPLTLFPLHSTQVDAFIRRLQLPPSLLPHLPLLEKLLYPNPRKIKRIVNILSFVTEVRTATQALQNLSQELLVRLVVLQVQSIEIFNAVARSPVLLTALEAVYAGTLQLDDASMQNNFGVRSQEIQKFCQDHHQPGSYLNRLFAGEPFKPAAAELPNYFAMFGGSA